MANDIASGCTVLCGVEPMPGFRLLVVQTAATADDGDYFDITDLTGLGGVTKIFFATGNENSASDGASSPMDYTPNTAGSTTITLGGTTDNVAREVLIICD